MFVCVFCLHSLWRTKHGSRYERPPLSCLLRRLRRLRFVAVVVVVLVAWFVGCFRLSSSCFGLRRQRCVATVLTLTWTVLSRTCCCCRRRRRRGFAVVVVNFSLFSAPSSSSSSFVVVVVVALPFSQISRIRLSVTPKSFVRPKQADLCERKGKGRGGGGGGGDLYCVFSLFPLLGSSYPVPPCACVASSAFSRFSRSFYSSFSSSLSPSPPPHSSYHQVEDKLKGGGGGGGGGRRLSLRRQA
jgi:hypothetical protein